MKKVSVVDDRWQVIREYVSGMSVLDLGSVELVGKRVDAEKKTRWLFGRITGVAKSAIGVDVDKDQVRALKKEGYNLIVGDAENIKLGKKFDVVVVGELIEHLSNPGYMLVSVKKHLKVGGHLLISTPNRFDFIEFARSFIKGRIPKYEKKIAKHVMYYDENSINDLLERHGFQVEKVVYYWTFSKSYLSLFDQILSRLLALIRTRFLKGLVVVARIRTR